MSDKEDLVSDNEETRSVYDEDDINNDLDIIDDSSYDKDQDKYYEDDEYEPDADEDDDEEEKDDEDVERPILKKRIHTYHPEMENTEIKIVPPHKRITSEYMTIYEYSMIVGTRATHITQGSALYTDPEGLQDARKIAKKEIMENKCPLSITRKISSNFIEVWEVNEMIKPIIN